MTIELFLLLVPFLLGTVLPGENEAIEENSEADDEWEVPSLSDLDSEDSDLANTPANVASQETEESATEDSQGEALQTEPTQQDTQQTEPTQEQGQQQTEDASQQQTATQQQTEPQAQQTQPAGPSLQEQRQQVEQQVAGHYAQLYNGLVQQMGDNYDESTAVGMLCSRVLTDAVSAVMQQVPQIVPAIVRQESQNLQSANAQEEQFYSEFPELKGRNDLRSQITNAYMGLKQAFPNASHEDLARSAGNMVLQHNGIQRQNAQQQKPQAASQPAQPQPFKPAGTSQTASKTPANGQTSQENNPWAAISQLIDAQDDA